MSDTPLLFVYGDSISMQYGPYLESAVQGVYRYTRKLDDAEGSGAADLDNPQGANGGDSSRLVKYFRTVSTREDWTVPDVVVVNCGLHDIKTDPQTGRRQVDLGDYRSNLKTAIDLIVNQLGVTMVWVRTTPADEAVHNTPGKGFHRFRADVDAYNAAADEIMTAHRIPMIDLHRFTQNLGGAELFCDHVHFEEWVRREQGAFIAGWLAAHRALRA